MKTFKQFISHKSPEEKKKPLDYAAIRAASAQSTPTQKTGSTKFVMHREEGLWDNIHAKRERIKRGSGERMRKPGSKGAPTKQNFVSAAEQTVNDYFDMIEDMVMELAQQHNVDPEMIWEDFESVDDAELLETAAWTRREGKNPAGGLNRKGIESYRRENPGSKLSMAVTTKPSKLDPDSKAAKRRKSFCARMGGTDGPMEKPNGEPTRKALALRKWNC